MIVHQGYVNLDCVQCSCFCTCLLRGMTSSCLINRYWTLHYRGEGFIHVLPRVCISNPPNSSVSTIAGYPHCGSEWARCSETFWGHEFALSSRKDVTVVPRILIFLLPQTLLFFLQIPVLPISQSHCSLEDHCEKKKGGYDNEFS